MTPCLKRGPGHVSDDWMSIPPIPSSLLQLLWFARVVEAGSFAEAARRAGVSTSAISKAISRFEQVHGARLFHRTTHSLSLTEEGDRLLGDSRLLLSDLERAETALADFGSRGAAGRVRVTAPTAFARTCLLPELPGFLRAHPEIEIELQSSDDIVDLAAHGIDIAVRSGSLDGLPGHVVRKLYTFPWIACATPNYFRAHGTPTTPAELVDHALIGFRSKATGQVDSWRFTSPADHKSFHYVPRARHVFDDGETAWGMIRAGFGIGWAPSWLGLEDLRSGQVVEVFRAWRTAEAAISAVRLDKRLTPQRTQVVLDFIAALPAAWDV
jgi:DNA-binding transcriptional LysR family regulator